jgi:hypothetical protein
MVNWSFHPIKPTKEAYEKKSFQHAKHVNHILELVSSTPYRVRGQISLKGTKDVYPEELWPIGHASFDGAHFCVDFTNLNQLKHILTILCFKEDKIERIYLYDHGFFLK